MRTFRILFLSLIISGVALSQTTVVFPGELNIQPFTSNFLEPRMGVFFQTGQNDLRLDIGASKDIFHTRIFPQANLSLGADFFTFTRLRGESGFHFPLRYFVYIGITAIVRLIIVDHESPLAVLIYSAAILILVITLWLCNSNRLKRE